MLSNLQTLSGVRLWLRMEAEVVVRHMPRTLETRGITRVLSTNLIYP